MTTENSAVVKIIAQKTKEYNDLDTTYKKLGNKFIFLKKRYDTLMEVHEKTIKALDNLTGKYEEQRRAFLHDWVGARDIFREDDDDWEYWVRIYEKWEGKK